jgi:hypothetical protein
MQHQGILITYRHDGQMEGYHKKSKEKVARVKSTVSAKARKNQRVDVLRERSTILGRTPLVILMMGGKRKGEKRTLWKKVAPTAEIQAR